uniref:Uncharacterized protein n=1 Tax=Anguilla anguilla TaxID=7936 RepID=A0A0E9SEZ1_ANGAN
MWMFTTELIMPSSTHALASILFTLYSGANPQ